MLKKYRNAVLIVAAGKSQRFQTNDDKEIPKQYQLLNGKPVINYSIETFSNHPDIDSVTVIINHDHKKKFEKLSLPNNVKYCFGGKTRQESVFNGLKYLEKEKPEHVLIHDAARPFMPSRIIDELLLALEVHPAVIPGEKVTDTLKKTDNNNIINSTVSREQLWRAQTPQAFNYKELIAIYQKLDAKQLQKLTDDASLFEENNKQVKIVQGSHMNLKITTKEDLNYLKQLSPQLSKTGMGYDVHKFNDIESEKEQYVTLCGIEIPSKHKLIGHSDADVCLHALTDALLGTMGLGDIGDFFPPSDPKWKGCSSKIFVQYAFDELKKQGGVINNIDLTIVCETPKISPYKIQMKHNLSKMLKLENNQINIKATTTEKLGAIGRSEGIACYAIANINLPYIP